MMTAPPLLTGAVKVTVACALPPRAMTAVGAPGAEEARVGAELMPAELVAVRVKV